MRTETLRITVSAWSEESEKYIAISMLPSSRSLIIVVGFAILRAWHVLADLDRVVSAHEGEGGCDAKKTEICRGCPDLTPCPKSD